MTLPLSGNSISMSQVNQELGRASPYNQTVSLEDSVVRTLFGKPTAGSLISMSDGFGKSNRPQLSFVFSASTSNASLNVTSISGYVAGSSDITITVNTGVFLWSTSNATPGLTLTGGTTGDTITLVNNGFIMGRGGDGLIYDDQTNFVILTAATVGGTALSLGFNTTVTNTSGYIGGGGGAGGSTAGDGSGLNVYGGGGAGGGNGAGSNTYAGGAGGGINSAGTTVTNAAGGGGGRILPGTGGASGGAAGYGSATSGQGGGAGGSGSAAVASGPKGYLADGAAGGGGGWGASGGSAQSGLSGNFTGPTAGAGGSAGNAGGNASGASTPVTTTAGTAGGKAVALNGRTITWTGGTASSSRAYGAVS